MYLFVHMSLIYCNIYSIQVYQLFIPFMLHISYFCLQISDIHQFYTRNHDLLLDIDMEYKMGISNGKKHLHNFSIIKAVFGYIIVHSLKVCI